MRNKSHIFSVLEKVEGIILNLRRIVNTSQPIRNYMDELTKLEEYITYVKDQIDREEQNYN